jgi:hypothetical protein
MKSTFRKSTVLVVLALLSLTLYGQQNPPQGPPQGAQPPAQNLKVLPKDMPRQQLMGVMGNWTRALGVKCDHCHAQDKASDEKPEKEVARAMVKMMMNLRQNANEFLPGDRAQKVSCWTCHRGSAKIEMPPPPPAPGPGAPPPPPKPPQQ